MRVEFINIDRYLNNINSGLKQLEKEDFLNRLLKRDFTLWKEEDLEISNRLGWLESPVRVRELIHDFQKDGEIFLAEGLKQVVLLGMGGSSLAPKTISDMLYKGKNTPGFFMLDSTCPEEILKLARLINAEAGKTVFIVSSKSGTTTETMCFLNFFYSKQKEILGDKAGSHFVAITDPNTPLDKTARNLGFRRIIHGFPDVGGRFSALSPFGLYPAALLGLDLNRFLKSAIESQKRLVGGDYHHPGIRLGATLGILAQQGLNKLTFLLPCELRSFGRWLEQLIAESTGKEGRGLLPLIETLPVSEEAYGPDRVFIQLGSENLIDEPPVERLKKISRSHPLIQIIIRPEELAEHFYLWELATATIGHFLGINPFDQPDVELTKQKTKTIIKSGLGNSEEALRLSNCVETQELSAFMASEDDEADYFSLLCFLPPDQNLEVALDNFSRLVSEKTGRPCTWNFGPAYLHSTGQLFKGDAGRGKFIFLFFSESEPVPIPDLPGCPAPVTSFNQLFRAQALADFQALKEKNRQAIFIDLDGSPIQAIFRLCELIRE